ncbi:MAG: elongation factor 1-beta [Candidatus Thermoplasmatota archaeon]|nr:elongation factor 1-beta [Candidatus Thermoplasmatota archaeon]MCL5438307.1 elongation factor 1-beta [Candidatus Thermoplasmatota archaeon]
MAVVFKILPDDAEADISRLGSTIKESLGDICEINRLAIEEIAFGLKSIRLETIMKDEEGQIGKVEDIIRAIPGISQIDTEDVTLV